MTPGDLCNFVVARQYSIVKELGDYQSPARAVLRRLLMPEQDFKFMVGLDRLELSTSPLSGARSSHLSYRPDRRSNFSAATGGAGRDRTGDLLNANQALSQLSYSPFVYLTRRPAAFFGRCRLEFKSRPIGCRTDDIKPSATLTDFRIFWQESEPYSVTLCSTYC